MGSHFGVGAPPILEPILVGSSLGVRAFDPWPCHPVSILLLSQHGSGVLQSGLQREPSPAANMLVSLAFWFQETRPTLGTSSFSRETAKLATVLRVGTSSAVGGHDSPKVGPSFEFGFDSAQRISRGLSRTKAARVAPVQGDKKAGARTLNP